MQLCIALAVLLAGLSIIAMILIAPHPGTYSYYAGLILVFIFGYTFFKLRFIAATIVGWLIVVFYEIAAIALVDTPVPVLINNNFFFLTGNLFGMFACYSIDLYSRRDFIHKRIIQDEKKKVHLANRQLGEKVENRTAMLLKVNNDLKEEIIERKRAEDDLRENEEKYRNILENMEEGYYEIDIAGNLTFFNDALTKITGFSRDELVGTHYRKFTEPGDANKVFHALSNVYISQQPSREFEWTIIKREGNRRYLDASVTLMKNLEGLPIGFRGIIRDVSERKQADEKIHKLNEELEQRVAERTCQLENAKSELERAIERANELAYKANSANKAKSEFLANMSHEIRTPLNGILGMAELALESASDSSQKELFDTLCNETTSLLGIINDILDFSKIEAGMLKLEDTPFDLKAIIDEVSNSMGLRAQQKNLGFNSIINADVPTLLMGDQWRLKQVLTNLSDNALKFTHQGKVSIEIEKQEDLGQKVKILFAIKDTGIGIPKNKLEMIFKGFTQADGSTTRKYGGTGLGTAISKQLAELMGGNIGAESCEGQGSLFWFTAIFLKQPIAEVCGMINDTVEKSIDKPASRSPLKIVKDPSEHSGYEKLGRILLVEDYPTNQLVAQQHLRNIGYSVDLAENGQVAVDAFKNKHYDLILMDIQMPIMDGIEATTIIRRIEAERMKMSVAGKAGRNGNIPIIAMTAYATKGHQEKCRQAGMDDYITKPLMRKDLLNIVAKWIKSAPKADPPLYLVGMKDDDMREDAPMNFVQACREFEGDKQFLVDVLTDFFDVAGSQIEAIHQAIFNGDVEKVWKEAHSIKGGAIC